MPPPEIPVSCAGCGNSTLLPPASIRRNSSYCTACGKQLDLSAVFVPRSTDQGGRPKRPKKSSRTGRGR